jgi:predicted GNAT family acetyltransferase
MTQGNYIVIHHPAENRFEVKLPPDATAVLIYSVRSGLFLLMHTEVPPAFEGQGIAAMMAKEALEFAKANGFKVRSYCSYTTRYIEKHPEYQGLMG